MSAARWLYLPAGTFRDYEQGRSDPAKIIEAGIIARIAAYEKAYTEYLAKKKAKHEARSEPEPEAVTEEPALTDA